jgi:hypothetical protein
MKNPKHFLLLLFLFFSITIFAQDSISVSKDLFKIDVLLPGFSYEHGITKKSTFLVQFGVGSAAFNSDEIYISPIVLGEYRYYYNLEKRDKKGKNISRNSGNYLGGNIAYHFVPFGHQNEDFTEYTTLAAFWGLQRTYKKGFYMNLQLGGYYAFDNDGDTAFGPWINYTLGFVLPEKK